MHYKNKMKPWSWKELLIWIVMLGAIGGLTAGSVILENKRKDIKGNEGNNILKRNGYLMGVIILSFFAVITLILFFLDALTYTGWKSKSANTTYKSGIKDLWNGLHQSHEKYWTFIAISIIVFAITLTAVGFTVDDLKNSNELVYVFFALAGIFFFIGFYSIGKIFDGRDFMWELYNKDKLEKYNNEIDDYQKNSSELNRIKLGLILEKSKDDVEKGITKMERRLEKMKEKGESEKSESILKLKEMIEDYTVRKTQLDEKAKLSGVEQEQLESENIKSRLGTIAGRTGLLSQKNKLAAIELATANEKLTAAKEAKEAIRIKAMQELETEVSLKNKLRDLESSNTDKTAEIADTLKQLARVSEAKGRIEIRAIQTKYTLDKARKEAEALQRYKEQQAEERTRDEEAFQQSLGSAGSFSTTSEPVITDPVPSKDDEGIAASKRQLPGKEWIYNRLKNIYNEDKLRNRKLTDSNKLKAEIIKHANYYNIEIPSGSKLSSDIAIARQIYRRHHQI